MASRPGVTMADGDHDSSHEDESGARMKNLTLHQTALMPLVVLLIAGFVLCSTAVGPLMNAIGPNEPGAILVFFCFGVIGAAAVTIATIGVLAPWPFWFRMPLSFFLGTMLVGAWTLGYATSSTIFDEQDSVFQNWSVVVFCYPIVFLAVQTPLWLMRSVGKWTITHSDYRPEQRPLTIRDILAGTAMIGFALAGAQLARQLGSSIFPTEGDFWIAIGGYRVRVHGDESVSNPTHRCGHTSIQESLVGHVAADQLRFLLFDDALSDRRDSGWTISTRLGSLHRADCALELYCGLDDPVSDRATAWMPFAMGT